MSDFAIVPRLPRLHIDYFLRQPARRTADACSNAWQPHGTSNALFRTVVSTRQSRGSSDAMVTIATRPGAMYNA